MTPKAIKKAVSDLMEYLQFEPKMLGTEPVRAAVEYICTNGITEVNSKMLFTYLIKKYKIKGERSRARQELSRKMFRAIENSIKNDWDNWDEVAKFGVSRTTTGVYCMARYVLDHMEGNA